MSSSSRSSLVSARRPAAAGGQKSGFPSLDAKIWSRVSLLAPPSCRSGPCLLSSRDVSSPSSSAVILSASNGPNDCLAITHLASRGRVTPFPRAASRRVSDGPAARYTATPREAVLRRVEPPRGSKSRLARLSPRSADLETRSFLALVGTFCALSISPYLALSPRILLYLPVSPRSPHISLYLPVISSVSPGISPYLVSPSISQYPAVSRGIPRHPCLAVDTVNKNRPYQGTRKTNTNLGLPPPKAPATHARPPARALVLVLHTGGQRA